MLAGRGNETVAAVAWIGYDPPQVPGTDNIPASLAGGWEVSHDDVAKAGAHDLARFYDGINASHQGPLDLTAIGHSYGSLTTGLALQEPGNHGVDNALFYGSPGIEATTPQQLGLQPGHVFTMETPDDPIQKVYDAPPLVHAARRHCRRRSTRWQSRHWGRWTQAVRVNSGPIRPRTRISRIWRPVRLQRLTAARCPRPAATATIPAGTASTSSSTPPDTTSPPSLPARHPSRRSEYTADDTQNNASIAPARRHCLRHVVRPSSNRMSREEPLPANRSQPGKPGRNIP